MRLLMLSHSISMERQTLVNGDRLSALLSYLPPCIVAGGLSQHTALPASLYGRKLAIPVLAFSLASCTALSGSLPSDNAAARLMATPGAAGAAGKNRADKCQSGNCCNHCSAEKCFINCLFSSTLGSPRNCLPILASTGPKDSMIWSTGSLPSY